MAPNSFGLSKLCRHISRNGFSSSDGADSGWVDGRQGESVVEFGSPGPALGNRKLSSLLIFPFSARIKLYQPNIMHCYMHTRARISAMRKAATHEVGRTKADERHGAGRSGRRAVCNAWRWLSRWRLRKIANFSCCAQQSKIANKCLWILLQFVDGPGCYAFFARPHQHTNSTCECWANANHLGMAVHECNWIFLCLNVKNSFFFTPPALYMAHIHPIDTQHHGHSHQLAPVSHAMDAQRCHRSMASESNNFHIFFGIRCEPKPEHCSSSVRNCREPIQ